MIESSEVSVGDHQKKESSSDESSASNEEVQASVEGLKKQIEELEKQGKEKENKYLYLYADFENFKKRAIKERSDLQKFGCESMVRELLGIVDNLERALSHIPSKTDKSLVEGLNMVLNQFKNSLQKQGVQSFESLEKTFDPNLHEAVGQEESDLPAGVITKEHSRGYTIHGRLLRPAQVTVSNGQ